MSVISTNASSENRISRGALPMVSEIWTRSRRSCRSMPAPLIDTTPSAIVTVTGNAVASRPLKYWACTAVIVPLDREIEIEHLDRFFAGRTHRQFLARQEIVQAARHDDGGLAQKYR